MKLRIRVFKVIGICVSEIIMTARNPPSLRKFERSLGLDFRAFGTNESVS
jgi:hypothetical protein